MKASQIKEKLEWVKRLFKNTENEEAAKVYSKEINMLEKQLEEAIVNETIATKAKSRRQRK